MTTIDAEYSGGQEHVVVRGWRAFKEWRHSRPFWAGLWTILAALELWSIPFLQPLLVQHKLNIKMAGIAGVSTMAITPALIMMAAAMWFAPGYRVFAGVFTLVCALLSMVVSNFGGFLLGMLLGVFGGGLAFSWTPRLTDEQIAAQARAEQAYRDALAGDMPPSARSPLAGAVESPQDRDPYQFQETEPQDAAAGPIPGVAGYQGTRGEMTSALPQTADSTPADTVPATPSRDVVPPLPRAEDTPLGA
ncbi:DUF6114 domain-containing protein [Catenulispora pinisilvae]|uniref:DUF6114 domain-containing protein n=1 Tax=Catenulispora pinisilvae TaxID=2705253 RepID=UPI0018926BCC|nr:DUF6114 domain-containing protein [Catenulispora pinisilvae]